MKADSLTAPWLLFATTGLGRSEALGLPWRAIAGGGHRRARRPRDTTLRAITELNDLWDIFSY
jgi:hypothetical protein